MSTTIQDLQKANPYKNVDYRRSGWQNFITSLGFRTNADAYQESLSLQSKEYDAALAEKSYNEEYDSAAAQTQRERDAGLNPDLTGNIDSGSSSALKDDGNPAIAPESDASSVGNFASVILSGVQMAFGLASGAMSAIGSFQNIRSKSLANDAAFLDNAFSALPMVSDAVDLNVKDSPDGVAVSNFNRALRSILGVRGARRYTSAVTSLASSLQGQESEFGLRSKRAGSRSDYYNITSGSNYSEFDDCMKEIRSELSDLFFSIQKKGAESQRAELVYNKEYYQGHDGAQMAAEDLEQNKGRTSLMHQEYQSGELKAQFRQSLSKMMSKLDNMANNGNSFANYLSMVLSVVGMKFLGE